jgi:hypothetical protein
MTLKYHPDEEESHKNSCVTLSDPLASPQRVIPNEVRDLAYEVHVPLDSQRNRPSRERSLAALGMTTL